MNRRMNTLGYKILTVCLYLYVVYFIVELIGVGFYLEPVHEQALMDMSGKNPTLFQEREAASVYKPIYNLSKLEFENQEKTWCKAENLYSLMYVPGLDSWIWTGRGDVLFRPYQKYGFHSYEAQSWSCSKNSFLILFWRIEYAIKTGYFGGNIPLIQ